MVPFLFFLLFNKTKPSKNEYLIVIDSQKNKILTTKQVSFKVFIFIQLTYNVRAYFCVYFWFCFV